MSTESLPTAAGGQRKLLGSLPVKLRIAAACVGLLLLGAWLRPRTVAPLTPPQERPAPLLDEQVQRAAPSLPGLEQAVADLPVRGVVVQRDTRAPVIAGDFGAAVPTAPPVFAVAVSDSLVVTHAAALVSGRPPTLTNDEGTRMATTIAAFDTATGMVLLSSPSPALVTPAFADAIPQLGSLVVGAARSNTTDVAIPLFITSVTAQRYGVGGTTSSAPPGLPIYNLEGGLLAVSAGDGTAWRIRYALDRLLAQAATGSLPSSIGVTFQVLEERLAAAIGATGLAIIDVAPGSPAEAAGVQRGDVITGVGSGTGAARADLRSALAALPAGRPIPLSLRRGGKDATVTVTPAFAHDMAANVADATPGSGPQARTLFERQVLEAASVPLDALVLMINGRTINSMAQGAREARRTTDAAVVLLEHRGRRFFAALETTR